MDIPSTARMLGHWHEMGGAEMSEAVAWFDEDDRLRVLVADYADGQRLDLRMKGRQRTVTITKGAA